MTDPDLYLPAPDSVASLLTAARRAARPPMPAAYAHLHWLTRVAAAELSGVSPRSLARYEVGERLPPLPVLRGILVAYQSSAEVCAQLELAWHREVGGSPDECCGE